MNGDPGNLNPPVWNASADRRLKKRFLVKLKRKFSDLDDCRHSGHLIKNTELPKYSMNELSLATNQAEECVFYYINGVIQMATLSGSMH